MMKNEFKDLKEISHRKFLAFNIFFSHKKHDKPFMELLNPDTYFFIKSDYNSLLKQTFRWEDIDLFAIEDRSDYLKNFAKFIPPVKLTVLNTKPFEELFSLEFIDLITETPNYSFGEGVYNKSLDYYTMLLESFITFYLKKDLANLEKINAEDIHTYTPFSRYYVFMTNQRNSFIKNKYFNEGFNLVKFAIKLVTKFVPGATWRWVGANHKCHIYCIEICKILVEYGLVNEEEFEDIKSALYSKLMVFLSLEKAIENDSAHMNKNIVDNWRDGLIKVREYYAEILISHLYYKQDKELISMMSTIYEEDRLKKGEITAKELENVIKFNKTVLFDEDYGRKMMEFLMGYIISQNVILKELLVSRKINDIVSKFLYIVSNVNDPYLLSVKLLREEDYVKFAIINFGKSEKIDLNLLDKFQGFTKEFCQISQRISQGEFLYREILIVEELMKIMEKIQGEIDYLSFFIVKSQKNYEIQRVLAQSNVVLHLFNIMTVCIAYTNHLKEHKDYKDLFKNYSRFVQFYFNDNYENHCNFFEDEHLFSIENTLYKAPLEVSIMILDIFKENSQIMIVKEKILDIFHDILKKLIKDYFANQNCEEFQSIGNVLNIIGLFINFNYFKIFDWIPEYDIRISMEFCKENYQDFFNVETYGILLRKNNEKSCDISDQNKLEIMMNFLRILKEATASRFVESSYKKIIEIFTKEKLIELMNLSKENYEFRLIFLDLYCNVYIDLKNHLLDKRTEYYSTKTSDPEYIEDPFYDQEFDKTIALFINEILHLVEITEIADKNKVDYMNSGLFSGIVKMINYIQVIKDDDLPKMLKYVVNIEDFYECLLANKLKILFLLGIFKTKPELQGLSEKDPLLSEIDHIDEKFKLKKDKAKILGFSKAIYDICSGFVQNKSGNTMKFQLLTRKNTINRIEFAKKQLDILSPQMKTRKENLFQPFMKIQRLNKKKVGIIEYLIAFYEHYKMSKMSVDSERNFYIASLRDNSSEFQTMTYNLCSFAFNKVAGQWNIDKKIEHFTMIESMCNSLFIATKSIQNSLLKVIKEKNNELMMYNIWTELKNSLSFVIFKTHIDIFWKEAYRKVLILIKFHQFLCEDGCVEFKNIICDTKALAEEDDKYKRIDRWMTIFQQLCDSCQWHRNYRPNEINEFEITNRPHLFPIGRAILDNLTEFCTGPHDAIQLKLYVYSYERYNGILHRYTKDPNSEFYKLKLSLIDYMLAMAEGLNSEIVNYHTTNFELQQLNKVLINSMKQLFYCCIKKDPFDKKAFDEYPLKFENFPRFIEEFESNPEFSHQTLFNICLKLFCYINSFSEAKSKNAIFLKERADALKIFEKTKEIRLKTITEEDLFVYKFMSKIIIKIEIVRSKYSPIVSFYFPKESKCFYLSEESKASFLKNVDRSSFDAKLSGLIAAAKLFLFEMIYSEKRFKTRKMHEFFASGIQAYIFEIITFLLTLANNLILLFSFKNNGSSDLFKEKKITILTLGIIEIILSLISIISFILLNYPIIQKINMKKYMVTHAYKKKINLIDRFLVSFHESFLNQKNAIFFFHIFFVILGITVSYGFIGIDFFSIITLFPTMKNIMKSVTERYDKLLTTIFLAGVIMYSYSTFVHLYFVDDFSKDFPGQTYCSSLSHCYFTIIDKAFRNGEGVGGLLTTAFYGKEGNDGGDLRFYGSLLLNLSFYLIINVVILNIILAVLVDTFSQLRKKQDFFSNFMHYFY